MLWTKAAKSIVKFLRIIIHTILSDRVIFAKLFEKGDMQDEKDFA